MGKFGIQFLSTYPPRECGIATFTQDLNTAVDKHFGPGVETRICAMNENLLSTYNYPKNVTLQIDEEDRESYLEAAERINRSKTVQGVCIQHEFGIFGGEYGDFLIPFLEELKKPCITTFHSIIPGEPRPERHMRYVVKKIAEQSEKVISISGFGKDILMQKYKVPREKIEIIPHGIPQIKFDGRAEMKKDLGYEGRTLAMTFGLLSKNKGIEYAIRALPPIVEKHPELLYLIVGETHPVVRRNQGEKYRKKLKNEAKKLGLKNHVMFIDKYLTLKELCNYLNAADIYITPYLDMSQISSGTLAYAVGAGKPCISTPYFFARDLLRHGRGSLVKPRSYKGIEKAMAHLLENPEEKEKMEKKSYKYSRSWLWPNIAGSYVELFKEAVRKE